MTAPLAARPSRPLHLATAFACLLLVLLDAAPGLAHDFWIEPTTFRPTVGSPVGLSLLVGEHFTGDTLPRDPGLQKRFVVVGPGGEGLAEEAPVAGIAGTSPAGLLAPAKAGLYVVGYESSATVAEMTRSKMTQYIEEEGLASQLPEALPARFPVTDAFSRSAKTLLLVPGGKAVASGTTGYDRRLGLPLELVPLADPYRLGAQAELPLELLYLGKPLGGILVIGLHRSDPLHPVKARTDREGRVQLPLNRPGQWLIKAVRIESTEGDPPTEPKADYRSLWASLTFEIPER